MVLENLNSALQKQESLSSNGKVIQANEEDTVESYHTEYDAQSVSLLKASYYCVSSAPSQPLSPAVEPGGSSDEVESVAGQESSQNCKRKRSAVETEPDRDSDKDSRLNHFLAFVLSYMVSWL